MKTSAFVLLSLIVLGLNTPVAQAADRVRAGQWETTLAMKSGPPTTIKTCMTATEAGYLNGGSAALRKYLEKSTAEKTNGRCALKDLKVNGNEITATTVCGKTTTAVTTSYHGDRYASSSTGGVTIKGKRLGACP